MLRIEYDLAVICRVSAQIILSEWMICCYLKIYEYLSTIRIHTVTSYDVNLSNELLSQSPTKPRDDVESDVFVNAA